MSPNAGAHPDQEFEQFARHRIVFEGRELPKAALFIDHLGMYGNLPGISDETSEWLWRFPICLGLPREDKAKRIIRCVTETLDLCHQHKDHLLVNFPLRFGRPFEPQFYSEWIWSFEFMQTIAKEQPACRWGADLIPGDKNYGRSAREVLGERLRNMDAAFAAARKKRWWEFWR